MTRHRPRALAAMLVGALLATAAPSSADDRAAVDVQHFWQAPAERAAKETIRRAFESRGGRWVDAPTADAAENRRLAFGRIIAGIAPFALQWHAGVDLRPLSDSGVIFDLTPLAEATEWPRILHPDILPYIQVGEAFYGLPIGIHAENWAWFNAPLLRRHGDSVPGTWHELEALLTRAADRGGPGIAMGTGSWQRLHVFVQILVSEGGTAAYRTLLERRGTVAIDRPALRSAFDTLGRLRRFDRHDPTVRTWREAAEAMARGDALVQFMGDWVRPELAAQGLLPGRDFECALSIGRDKRHISVIDVFLFPMREGHTLTTDHHRLIDAVLAPDTQLALAGQKGAIPVRADLDSRIDDPCLASSYALYATPGASVPASAMIADERALAALEAVVSGFWDDRAMDTEAALERLGDTVTAPARP